MRLSEFLHFFLLNFSAKICPFHYDPVKGKTSPAGPLTGSVPGHEALHEIAPEVERNV